MARMDTKKQKFTSRSIPGESNGAKLTKIPGLNIWRLDFRKPASKSDRSSSPWYRLTTTLAMLAILALIISGVAVIVHAGHDLGWPYGKSGPAYDWCRTAKYGSCDIHFHHRGGASGEVKGGTCPLSVIACSPSLCRREMKTFVGKNLDCFGRCGELGIKESNNLNLVLKLLCSKQSR
ncbi:hypothetical protein AVEN_240289-1 [Araneus ventricosus]|uniref:Uncharacterized protein n=1 Tax=Araneus ventricosus TaxID=182803 RepID=A0A4Y2X9U4_ARAVE|nr:hypothetical protein AVEN_240289-1 [Araneus ventricosus]